MRTLVVWLLALCACESRYGVYFNVDGDANEIRFNHVELYFGKNGTSSASIGKPSGPAMGKAFEHDINDSDAWDVEPNKDGSLATETTYYLPINDEDRELGYVAALAFDTTKSDKPVGVGEVLGFKLEDGIVNKYDIELQKADLGVELWGPGCFAWTRARGDQFSTTIAVLSPNDADCDGMPTASDCNDLCPSGSTTCDPDLTVCGTPSVCGLACTKDMTCDIQTCLPDLACDPICVNKAPLPSLEDRMNCIAADPSPHFTMNLEEQGGKPCRRNMFVTLFNRPCTSPRIVWRQTTFNDGWTIDVQAVVGDPMHCEVILNNTSTTATFVGDHHVLVAFPPLAGARSEWTVLLGVRDSNASCSGEGFMVDPLSGAPNDCP